MFTVHPFGVAAKWAGGLEAHEMSGTEPEPEAPAAPAEAAAAPAAPAEEVPDVDVGALLPRRRRRASEEGSDDEFHDAAEGENEDNAAAGTLQRDGIRRSAWDISRSIAASMHGQLYADAFNCANCVEMSVFITNIC